MFAILLLTLNRLREPAFVIIFLIGCAISYMFAGVGPFEVAGLGLPSDVTPDETMKNAILLGTVLLTMLSMLITIFIAASEIPRDVSSRMISIFLSKPLSRLGYLFGKFFGSLAIGLLFGALWLAVLLSVRYGVQGTEETLTSRIVVNQYICLLMLLPSCALSICVSCFFSDVIAMIVTCVYVLLSFAVGIVPVIINILQLDKSVEAFALSGYYLIPNLTYFVQVQQSPALVASLFVYALSSSVIFILIGRTQFDRGDIF